MADIELVIKIPKKTYKLICDKNALGCDVGDIKNIIRNGTPLPKGHGRLIDADEVNDAIYKRFEDIQCYDGTGYDIYSDSKESINKIPTIIEADKAESEGEDEN